MTRMTTAALQRLKDQRVHLDARIRQAEALNKARQRQQDLQRKILVGTYILQHVHREGRYAELVTKLDGYLTRDNDRQLFDLPPRGDKGTGTTPPEPGASSTKATMTTDTAV